MYQNEVTIALEFQHMEPWERDDGRAFQQTAACIPVASEMATAAPSSACIAGRQDLT